MSPTSTPQPDIIHHRDNNSSGPVENIPDSQTVSSIATSSTFSSSEAATPSPATPQRGRYPQSLGRVPLHRRGTSKTYERLEDLLREAGYKETRVFTPETERIEAGSTNANDSVGSGIKIGVGKVVEFLTGFMPSAMSSSGFVQSDQTPTASTSAVLHRPPNSPLAHKTKSHGVPDPNSPSLSRSTTETSSLDSLTRFDSPSPHLVGLSHELPHQHHRTRHHRHTQPHQSYSKAHAYLRHISSAPSMQQPAMSEPGTPGNDWDREIESQPPLPGTWLETVARAVLLGGPGSFIGGPVSPSTALAGPSKRPRHAPSTLRQSRSSLSQGHPRAKVPFLPDRRRTHARASPTSPLARSVSPLPPALCARIQSGRGKGATLGEVALTRVVCWSAPASRAASREREGDRAGGKGLGFGGDAERRWEKHAHAHAHAHARTGAAASSKGRSRVRGRGRSRKDLIRDGVPTLARTSVEGDLWSKAARADGPSNLGPLEDEDDEDGSEDEGELDLAKMLVPSIRQNSIRSLRKHLAGTSPARRQHQQQQQPGQHRRFGSGRSSLRHGFSTVLGSSETEGLDEHAEDYDDEDGEQGGAWGRRRRQHHQRQQQQGSREGVRVCGEDEEEAGGVFASLLGGSANGMGGPKKRTGIPVWLGVGGH